MNNIRIGSLFSGVCGLEQSFLKDPKFKLEFVADPDKYCSAVLSYLHPNTPNLGSVADIVRENKPVPDVDLIIAGTSCFIKGTNITTSKGTKSIEDIIIGDEVLTHTGKYKKVEKLIKNKTNEIYDIKIMGAETISTTKEHPFYIYRNGEFTWVEAQDLKIGDMSASYINQSSVDFNWQGSICKTNANSTEINKTLPLKDRRFWWLIGRYLADGYTSNYYRKDRKNSETYRVALCTGKHEEYEIEEVIGNLFPFYKTESRTTFNYTFYSKELFDFVSIFGKYAHGKSIPKEILDLPKDLLLSLFEGFMSGDGWIKKNKVGNKSYQITTVSPSLAYGMSSIVHKIYGVAVCISKYKTSPTKVIEGRTVNQRDFYITRFTLDSQRPLMYKTVGEYILKPIRKIKIREVIEEDVFNIDVEDDNSYCANGVIVHNCQNFSYQGDQLGLEGLKSKMFYEFAKIVKSKQPKYVIWENVVGASTHKDFKIVKDIFKEIGYEIDYEVFDASRFSGTIQQRRRIILLATRKDFSQVRLDRSIPNISLSPEMQNLKERLVGFSKSHRSGKEDENGEITEDERIDARINYGIANTLVTGWGCSGVSTKNYINENGILRELNINEAELLMTWKKDHTKYGFVNGDLFEIPMAQRFKMCGNGVVSEMIENLFRNIEL